jgi:hypothetical protein
MDRFTPMKLWVLLYACLPVCAMAQGSAPNDGLRYSINWPSGLSLGEAQATSTRAVTETGERWEFHLSLEAGVPGFHVADKFTSRVAGADLCSLEFEKDTVHGKKKTRERTEFDQQRNTATRETLGGGGKSELQTSSCARDALAFLHHTRRELAQGRIPPPQTIYFGAPYRIRLEYGGTQHITVSDARLETDRLIASLKGPASEFTIEFYFARDASRTPVLVKVPLQLGTFSMELVR